MPTEVLPTRRSKLPQESFSSGFAASLAGHLLILASIVGAVWVSHWIHPNWGEANPTVGAIQASMVSALPLPPKQPVKDNAVLTSETPSPAPKPPAPTPAPPTKATPLPTKTAAAPKPTDIPIPIKTPPVKAPTKAETEQPAANRRPTPPPPPTPKATHGETSGVQIPQSIADVKNGTAAITIEDRVFGDRYAYYVNVITRKIRESKAQDNDPPDTKGRKTVVHFIINRDGTLDHIQLQATSGSSPFDISTIRAIQRIDTFGPLPAGNELPVSVSITSR